MNDFSPSSGRGEAQTLVKEGVHLPKWCPKELAFVPYMRQQIESLNTSTHQSSGLVVRKPFVGRLTKDIVATYQTCNPKFKYSEELNPKRYLTSPSIGTSNDGFDNVNADLILTVNTVLSGSDKQRRYVVKDVLGHGTFGQVAKCWVAERNNFVAVKIIKNEPAYYQQSLVEVSILAMLNKKYDPEDKHHIVRIYDYFVYQRHLCICFELLDTNLFELIKINHYRGLSLNIIQLFSKQILRGLALLKTAGLIHCDLKPENILLCTSVKPAEIKIIDFGSACMEDRTVYSYIQSRYYRSPEVLLGYQYTTAIDMWSLGCIVAELFLGLPLFPGASEFDLLRRMIEILGGQPPDYILKEAKCTSKFFKCIGTANSVEKSEALMGGRSVYQALTIEEYEARDSKKPSIGKEYFNRRNLESIVANYPYRKNLPEEDIRKESQIRLALIDFLRGLIQFDPAKRWSPLQASKHPFVTGERFTCPYNPPAETPHLPVSQNIKVDHHPGGGHWFPAGLSPNLSGRTGILLHNAPHIQMSPYTQANGYGSIGSHGSYNDSVAFGSSYGSYGDANNMFTYYSPVCPSGMNMRTQGGISMLGTSPDTRQRIIPYPHGNGLGMSPSSGGFAPLPLGSSPSQFTPPTSYGPTSPARTSCHGSPLGKMAAVSNFNRRKGWGYSGSHDNSSMHWQGKNADVASSSQGDGNPQALGSLPSHLPSYPGYAQNMPGSFRLVSSVQFPHSQGENHGFPDATQSLPDPGDWDPNYSDEQLLQDGSPDMSLTAEFSKGMHIGSADTFTGFGRFNRPPSMSSNLPYRPNQPIQNFSHVDMGNPPSAYDQHSGYGRSKPSHFTPHISQNSPSRFGQQSVQRFNHGRPSLPSRGTAEWNDMKVQLPPPSFHSGGQRSPGTSSLHKGHKGANIPPASRGRKDYGRIS